MPKIMTLLVLLLALLMTQASVAQQQRGDFEAQLTGFYFTTVGSDLSLSLGTIQGKLGYFFTDHFEFGVGPTFSVQTISTTSSTPVFDPISGTVRLVTKTTSETSTDFGTTVFFVYSFLAKGAKAVPYFGAQFYKQSFKNTEDKGSVGVDAGIKFFFTRKAAFDLAGNYLFSLNKDQTGGILMFSFGLSYLF